MEKNNVYSNAKIITNNEEVKEFQLGTFVQNSSDTKNIQSPNIALADNNTNHDSVISSIKELSSQLNIINQKITTLENNGLNSKQIDKQVIKAIQDLKHYASFFEQATFQMESKLLKTSISIAQKIISIEIGENSSKIAKETISHLLDKIKSASKIKIHINPKDYEVLKYELKLESFIELISDINVTIGGVVIASDLGNFDGNIESKVNTILETLDSVI